LLDFDQLIEIKGAE